MEHSIGYVAGLVFGLLVSIGFLVFAGWLMNRLGGKIDMFCKKESYDERQLLARGQAYRAGFFTLIVYMVIIFVMGDLFEIVIFMSLGGLWLGICISLLVFAAVCIFKDAYMSLYENAKGVSMLFSGIGILNLVIGILHLIDGEPLLKNGAISYRYVNLIVGILFFFIVVLLWGKLFYDKKQDGNEE